MKSVKELVDEEIQNSNEYAKRNVGRAVGEYYSEFVQDVAKSGYVVNHLLMGLLAAGLLGRDVTETLQRHKGNPDLSRVITENSAAFAEPLSFMYWGIQVGRKLERQEIEELKRLEKL